jgi:glycine betaine/proline transport system substrate-binding protein
MKTFASLVLALGLAATAAQADAPACKAVRLADLGWTDIRLTDATAEVILTALGYEPSETLLGLDVAYVSLREGDMDVFQGNWRPVQNENYAEFFDKGWVEDLGENLTGAKFTLAVPKYVADQGVTSFEELARRHDMFGGKIYGIEPGSNQYLLDMIAQRRHGFDDSWEVVESSEAGMLAQLERALKKNEPIVFLGWEPHPMNINYQITYLSGGDEEFGPDFGGSTVHTLSRPGFAAECPNAARFFSQLVFNLEYENLGMRMIMTDGAEPQDAARAMMTRMPQLLDGWLKGVTTIDGQEALPVVKTALGLN